MVSKMNMAATTMSDDEGESEKKAIATMVMQQNRKKKKSGGFQSMGLNPEVYRAIIKKGYRVPTPIQRKTIPLILEGRDVVAMARTGSGKTACFLIPLFQKLKARSAQSGARALILSPTKELAMQTKKFTHELGRFTGLKAACILGGESMEKQFALIHENPDVIIATPGRFMHICVEMGLRLNSIEYVVFDEADRLFEMGFGEQLREILGRLPDARQTLLFSATLPKLLVDFAKAGLSDPSLVRLDVDTKIPETLKLGFFHCRPEGKIPALLHLLTSVIGAEEQTVVFCETRHQVEYLRMLLDSAGIENTYIYSHLDSTARKINAAKFQMRKVKVLLVTDLAARGIDIPLLDNVINFNFPPQAKLFIHRVGRVARAGRAGRAFSLVAGDEIAYLMDLQLFLGNSLNFIEGSGEDEEWHNKVGEVPQHVYDDFMDQINTWHDASLDLNNMKEVCNRGHMKYLKSRPSASHESIKRVKNLLKGGFVIKDHPLMVEEDQSKSKVLRERTSLLDEIRNFRPSSTIFEIGNTKKSSYVKDVMNSKRTVHKGTISRYHQKTLQKQEDPESSDSEENKDQAKVELAQSSQADIESAFSQVVNPKPFKKAKAFNKTRKPKRKMQRDEENFIQYQARDHHTEAGYSLMSTFDAQAQGAVLDLTGDDDETQKAKKSMMKWDAKKKRYVRQDANEKKKIKTESGVWIQASYKSDRYNRWKEKSKLDHLKEAYDDEAQAETRKGRKRNFQGLPSSHPAMKKAKMAIPKHKKGPKIELKRPEQVLKQRKMQERSRQKNKKKDKRKKR